MIDKTRKKLRETQFFCRQLISERQHDPEAFLHYLSAFLSAARSTTLVLQYEESDKYKVWFDPWRSANCTKDESELLDFMNQQRRAEVHLEGAATTPEWEAIPMAELINVDMHDGPPAYGFHWFGPPSPAESDGADAAPNRRSPETKRRAQFFGLGGNKTEVTETCERYTQFLARMVRDFMASYPSPLP